MANILVLLILILFYVLMGVGLMTIAKNENINGSWMAWFPVLNLALMAKIGFENKIIHWGLPITFLLTTKVDYEEEGIRHVTGPIIPEPFAAIIGFMVAVLTFVCIYRIYNKYSDKAVMMLVLTILSAGTLLPVYIFYLRNNSIRN